MLSFFPANIYLAQQAIDSSQTAAIIRLHKITHFLKLTFTASLYDFKPPPG